MKDYLTMDDVMLDNKRVLVRVDFNSPMDPSGNILDDKRIKSHLDTLRALEDCRVVLMAHQSRAGKKDYTTLEAHARLATRLLRRDVTYIDDIFGSHAQKRHKIADAGGGSSSGKYPFLCRREHEPKPCRSCQEPHGEKAGAVI